LSDLEIVAAANQWRHWSLRLQLVDLEALVLREVLMHGASAVLLVDFEFGISVMICRPCFEHNELHTPR